MEILRWAFLAGVERRTFGYFTAAFSAFCAVVFLVALCAKSVVTKKEVAASNSSGGWKSIRSKMLSAVRNGGFRRNLRDKEGEISFLGDAEEGEGRRISVATPPPLWQKKIIMGERCELPTFSGLILYDEKGNALPHATRKTTDFR